MAKSSSTKLSWSWFPNNKWVFDYRDLRQRMDEGKQVKRSAKEGKIIVEDYGIQFTSDTNPRDNFRIDDYDNIHAIVCQKNGARYDVAFKGRKVNSLAEDAKDVQDPMEKM